MGEEVKRLLRESHEIFHEKDSGLSEDRNCHLGSLRQWTTPDISALDPSRLRINAGNPLAIANLFNYVSISPTTEPDANREPMHPHHPT